MTPDMPVPRLCALTPRRTHLSKMSKKRPSAHVFTSEDAELDADDASALKFRTYYCKFCGEHVLTTTANLELAPRRRTDDALIIDRTRYATKTAKTIDREVIAIKRKDGTMERRRRLRCGDVPVGYVEATTGTRKTNDDDDAKVLDDGGTLYVHPGALSAFDYADYEREVGDGRDGEDAGPPPPCVGTAGAGATQIDLEIKPRSQSRAVSKITASAVVVDVTNAAHACDSELMEFLAKVLDLRLAQMSLLKSHAPHRRTLLAKGVTPRKAYAALRREFADARARANKLQKLAHRE